VVDHVSQSRPAAVGLHEIVVVLKRLEIEFSQQLSQACRYQTLFAVAKIEAEVIVCEFADLLILKGGEDGGGVGGAGCVRYDRLPL
jgi:hypothetical protein